MALFSETLNANDFDLFIRHEGSRPSDAGISAGQVHNGTEHMRAILQFIPGNAQAKPISEVTIDLTDLDVHSILQNENFERRFKAANEPLSTEELRRMGMNSMMLALLLEDAMLRQIPAIDPQVSSQNGHYGNSIRFRTLVRTLNLKGKRSKLLNFNDSDRQHGEEVSVDKAGEHSSSGFEEVDFPFDRFLNAVKSFEGLSFPIYFPSGTMPDPSEDGGRVAYPFSTHPDWTFYQRAVSVISPVTRAFHESDLGLLGHFSHEENMDHGTDQELHHILPAELHQPAPGKLDPQLIKDLLEELPIVLPPSEIIRLAD